MSAALPDPTLAVTTAPRAAHGAWPPWAQTLALAALLVVASSAFVWFFAKMAEQEFGGPAPTLSAMCRWDCEWYRSIAEDGYTPAPLLHPLHPQGDGANWAFFPVFPMVAKGLAAVTGWSTPVALVLTSKLFLFLSIAAFVALAGRELGPGARVPGGVLVAFGPYVVYAHAGYTESAYFFLSALGLLLLSQRRFVAAGLAGAALSGTRLVGLLFVLPYLLQAWREWRGAGAARLPRLAFGALLIPLGLALFMAWLHLRVGDALAFKNVQVAWERAFVGPVQSVVKGLVAGGWPRVYAATALLALLLSGWLAWQRRFGQALFLAGATLIPLSTGLQSIPRHVWWQVPFVFALLDAMLRTRALVPLWLSVCASIGGFVTLSWVLARGYTT